MKNSPLKKKTKLTSEKLRKKAATIAKLLRRTIENFTCEYCGKKEPEVQTHGAHIYEEGSYRGMSADLDNILCLCFTHHLGSWNAREPSWHSNPLEMVEWLKRKYPARAKELKKRSRKIMQCDETYWNAKLAELETYKTKI